VAMGHTVIGLSRGSEKHATLQSLGAALTLDPSDPRWRKGLAEFLGKRKVDLAIDSMTTVWPHAKQGTVRAVGVTTPKRVATAPDVAAIGETVKGYEATAWQGLFAPAGVPKPVLDKIDAEAKRVWNLPEVKKNLVDVGADSVLSENPAAFAAFTRVERAKWAEVVKAAGVKIQ